MSRCWSPPAVSGWPRCTRSSGRNREFLDAHRSAGRSVRGIGEPIWPGRSEVELADCAQHESLLNLAFGDGPAWRLLCPYDENALPQNVLEEARANHPVILAEGELSVSEVYHPERARRALRGPPLPPPGNAPVELPFTTGELASVRRLVERRCLEVGTSADVTDDLVLCVNEIATNGLAHGGGRGVLRVWREADALVCEVSDSGTIADPLVGRARPALGKTGGRGVWLANQLCDLVQVRSGAAGTVVRLHTRLTDAG